MTDRPPKRLDQVRDRRRQNLRFIADEMFDSRAALMFFCPWLDTSRLSQMIGPNPTRPVTEATARKVEQALGLPEGFMDEPLSPENRAVAQSRRNDLGHSVHASPSTAAERLLLRNKRKIQLAADKRDVIEYLNLASWISGRVEHMNDDRALLLVKLAKHITDMTDDTESRQRIAQVIVDLLNAN